MFALQGRGARELTPHQKHGASGRAPWRHGGEEQTCIARGLPPSRCAPALPGNPGGVLARTTSCRSLNSIRPCWAERMLQGWRVRHHDGRHCSFTCGQVLGGKHPEVFSYVTAGACEGTKTAWLIPPQVWSSHFGSDGGSLWLGLRAATLDAKATPTAARRARLDEPWQSEQIVSATFATHP